MARTHRTTHKSIGRLPVGQLAPQNVPQPQESQPDVPQEASLEEEPFEIELVIPERPTAQDSPAEEQQQPGDHDTEDKTNKEHPPRVIPNPRRCTKMLTRWSPSGQSSGPRRQTAGSAGAPRHHHCSPVQDQGSLTFRAGGVQGHCRDFLWIQSPLPTQGTSFQDFS
jgi:hypothetical protein